MTTAKKYIKKYWKHFSISIIFLTIEALCDLIQPTIMSRIIDIGVANKDMDYVFKMALGMLGITAIGAIGAIGRNIVSSNVSQKFGSELRSDLFEKIQNFSFDQINDFDTASLIMRLTNDVQQVQGFAHRMMRIFVKAPLLSIGSFIMAFLLDPGMTLILLVVVAIIGILIYFNMQIGYPFFRKVQKAFDRLNGIFREFLAGIRVVKAFNRFDYESKRFGDANQELASITADAQGKIAVFSPAITLTVNLGIVAVIWYGGISVSYGHMEVGKIIAFINYMTQILHSLMMISMVFNGFVRAKASYERIDEVFQKDKGMMESEDIKEMSKDKGQIEFENVYFSYERNLTDPVLKKISFTCKSGETVGIIGATGSGKSTLVHLVPRFYDVTKGNVKVNGGDVRNINPKTLRGMIGIVPQKTMLFTGTILENIKWGNERASEDEVIRAASLAQAHEFITAFPKGYDTMLGQGGVNLSGGQKQRIAIARALIKNPTILIMDDCTSAVDVVTEERIRDGLKEFSRGLTTLIVAQRITSVIGADKIIVLDHGNVIGIGNHKDLLESCKVYQDIFYSQIGREGMEYGI
ncbi:ATP-binding cassette subfamily B protein [Anaerosolibacter carboniphilus]|uniref:ATP-binding cassette subfamily B protein n=1 Tax=Anaerosolibacter carboniphilus TaxID=1417629 RepID=A0A841KQP2_9FIRM|nr:ABC transporter ATP-binding protein [Anaerosolibacter carboniphilus]MBB6215747.1 ATP-binding cassette subfamily B protein [Anaerosolibacter carboniphilus]